MSANANKIQKLELELQNLKLNMADQSTQQRYATTGVFGVGNDGTKEEAKAWLEEKIDNLTGGKPHEIYTKGDFNGIVFAKFDSQRHRDKSVEAFRKANLQRAGSRMWATEDTPIEERACKSTCGASK